MARILIVTRDALGRTGTEIVTCETAKGLRKRGHEVAIFTLNLGALGNALACDGFTVVKNTALIPWVPDVIHANHTYPLVEAFARFPDVPVLSICHDASAWYNEPVALPTIRKHAAVSVACRDRIVGRFPHLVDNVELLHNAVDLDAFKKRTALPTRPQWALILSHHKGHIPAIRATGRQIGFNVHALGSGVGKVVADLPSRLVEYDLVFATGRMALEALAVGCAEVVVDENGLAGMVTTNVLSKWRDHNFGFTLLTRPVSIQSLMSEVQKFDPFDAVRVSEFIRRRCALSLYLDRLEAIYSDMLGKGPCALGDRNMAMIHLANAFRLLVMAFERQMEAETIRLRVEHHVAVSRTAYYRLKRLLPHWLNKYAKRLSSE